MSPATDATAPLQLPIPSARTLPNSAGRVNGDLAVSRALGDFLYKDKVGLLPEEQAVCAQPDIKWEARNKDTDLYLVLACDGVWDVMSNQARERFACV